LSPNLAKPVFLDPIPIESGEERHVARARLEMR
jgi:hypothetical protein